MIYVTDSAANAGTKMTVDKKTNELIGPVATVPIARENTAVPRQGTAA